MNMKMLKILHIGNGKAFKIKAIVSFFRDRGHEMHFIPTPPVDERWDGVIYHNLAPFGRFSKFQVLRNIHIIRHISKKIQPHIIHAHTAGGPGWYGAFCRHHPYIIHGYGSDLLPYHYGLGNIFSKVLTMYACKQADKIIVTGKHMVQGASHLKIPDTKFNVLPRGVNLKAFRPGLDTTELKIKLNLNNSWPVIFSPRYQLEETYYNFDTIIESIPHIKKFYPDVLFLQLYGEGTEKEKKELEDMALNLGVSRNYKMLNAVANEEMPLLYNLTDAVVSVPSTDGFPVTVLEASACGVPLVVTKLDFTTEWFRNDQNGIVIPVRDSIALSKAILKLLDDQDLKLRIIVNNRKQVEERADYDKCMLELEKIYYKLLNRKPNVFKSML
jgi:glycosyltransferase involved in cell wall biosynthesis